MDNEILKNEVSRCLGCRVAPCAKKCPLGVSPHDFILAVKNDDFVKAAESIAERNPLPQTCGLVCPDMFCQSACIRAKVDKAIEIPCLQAEIMKRGGLPKLHIPQANGKKAIVVGGGPAGLGAVFELVRNGWNVELYEKKSELGGVARLIPERRLPKKVLDEEIARLVENERVVVKLNTEVKDFEELKSKYDGVILALGEPTQRKLGINGEELCLSYTDYLCEPQKYCCKKAVVIGGGEVALDCALSLKEHGAEEVEMFVRRRREDMRIMARDFKELDENGIVIRQLTSVTNMEKLDDVFCLTAVKNLINCEGRAEPCLGTETKLMGYDNVIMAMGSYFPKKDVPDGVEIAGDMTGMCGTVVQALVSGRDVALKLINGL